MKAGATACALKRVPCPLQGRNGLQRQALHNIGRLAGLMRRYMVKGSLDFLDREQLGVWDASGKLDFLPAK
jgi:hypothetical protein